ncbi:hypothetical protein GCM10009682_38710 [Luedemannella flava]|uniref:DUF4760 domain-containing protein n=1 Tax=Luedemannella flava TaxID=349316 RepID=A0ABN2M8G1_9ACTN
MGTEDDGPRSIRARTALALFALVGSVTLTIALLAAGALAVAAIEAMESPAVWQRWANVGESFGVFNSVLSGLAFVALVGTLWIQYRELSLQRAELRLQRAATERASGELRRSADAGMRMLHFELLKMSIEDPALAQVWPDATPEADDLHRRQMMYANLVFQHAALAIMLNNPTDEQIRESLRYLFASEVMRRYWATGAAARRQTQVPGTESWRVARIGDEVCEEYGHSDGGTGEGAPVPP